MKQARSRHEAGPMQTQSARASVSAKGGLIGAFAWALWLTAALLGCAETELGLQQLPTPQQQYLIRLARVLDQTLPPLDWPVLPPPPRPRELIEPIVEQQIDWLELLALNQCDLGDLIGYRNSGLGRVLSTSERWLYEHELLTRLKACKPPAQQRDRFAQLVRDKTAQLPLHRYNALLGGPEWRALVSAHARTNAQRWQPALGAELERALYALLESADPTTPLTSHTINDALHTLRFTSAGSAVRQTWRRQRVVLNAAAELLVRAQAKPLCRNGEPTPRARNLNGVFTRYYVEQIQPDLAAMPHPERGWLQALQQLVFAALPPGVPTATQRTQTATVGKLASAQITNAPGRRPSAHLLSWHNAVFSNQANSEFARWRAAVNRHSDAWRWHLETCGLLPKPGVNGLRE